MKENVRLIERIVVPVAGTDGEYVAQQWAVELASALDVPVRAVHVAPPGSDGTGDVFRFIEKKAAEWETAIETAVVHGDDVVDELVNELSPLDLVVIGTERLKGDYRVGSVAANLLRRAPCPVQMVRLR